MPNTTTEKAYRHIREKLFSGELMPGSWLREVVLAQELGMSRTPVREAIRSLEKEGLLEQRPRRGTRVKLPDEQELRDCYDLRCVLEGYAAGQAAKRISKSAIRALKDVGRKMMDLAEAVRAGGLKHLDGELAIRWSELDAEFHNGLLAAAGNQQVVKVVNDLHLITRVFKYGRRYPPTDLAKVLVATCEEHNSIVEAIEKKDAAAVQQHMEQHILRAEEEHMSRLRHFSEKRKPRKGGNDQS